MSDKKPSLEYELYIEGDSLDEDTPSCQVCHKTFLDYQSRNQHVMTAHDIKDQIVKVEKPALDFVIDVEEKYEAATRKKSKSFETRTPSHKRFTTNHRSRCRLLRSARKDDIKTEKATPPEDVTFRYSIPCLESNCESMFPFVQDLRNHLVIDHNFPLQNEVKLKFSSLQEFEHWKVDLEKKQKSRWVKHHTKTFKLHRILVYDCSHMIKNRIQADVYCTSQIIVKAFKGEKEQLEVSYFERHYGHDYVESPKRQRQSQTNNQKLLCTESGEEASNHNRCHICNKIFVDIIRRDRHIKNMHKKEKVPECPRGPIECLEPNCGKKFRVRRFLRQHLISEHNFEMGSGDTLYFSTLEEFANWKSNLEEETQSFYKKRQRDTNKTYKLTIQYECCRSGKMFNTHNRKRNLKIHGSRRSNIHCTSEIKLRYLDVGFEVLYFKDHYGHDNSLVHLPVPKKVRQEIAAKLMAGQPVTSIVQELRLSSGDQLNRKHLIRKKDVINIKAAYGIKTPKAGRAVSKQIGDIDTWVNETKANSDGVIIFYKPVGAILEELEETDFLVVCMTPFQREMVGKFGGDRICIDSSCDGNSMTVCELSTILVVNEYEEGIPIAFCLSSRVNMPTLRWFFSSVKDVVGPIQCHTFVAIEDPQFYNAWCEIMETPPCHVMCAWHIDAAWRFKLGSIVNKNKRKWIYERLKACQLQCDINEFTEMFQSLLDDLESSEDTQEFCMFMNEYYAQRPEMWANAHRIGIKINTNLYLDNFHRIIKRNFMLGREKHRIEKCISAINDYILDREYDQLVEYCRKKVLTKLHYIIRRHEAGIALVSAVAAIIYSSCWAVSSPSQDLIYVVNRVESHNCDASCTIFCQGCMACLKGYTCSCDDNAIKGNVCEHLHAVAEYRKSYEEEIQFVVIEGNEDVLMDQDEAIVQHQVVNEKCTLVVKEDNSIIDESDTITDQDCTFIENDDKTTVNKHTIVIEEQSGDRATPYSMQEVSDSKNELISDVIQLMNDLSEFRDVIPAKLGDQIKQHIDMARKLMRESKSKKSSCEVNERYPTDH